MTPSKVCVVFGTRPEAIKLAPVIQCLERQPDVERRLLVSGQHRELLDQVLKLFGIYPERDLSVMREDQRLGSLTAQVIEDVEQDLQLYRPDWVIVQGDTTTAFAAALAAFYARVPVAHVEAGLRTRSRYNPFPEEINRRFVDHLADLHFAPTERARQNLLQEGVPARGIHVTGNTGVDALLQVANRHGSGARPEVDQEGRRLLLVTAHRRESFGPELLNVCHALRALVTRNPDVRVIYAIHPNPNVTEPVGRALQGLVRVELIPAPDYAHFVDLMTQSFLILTDSGGIQEEAPSLGKPVLVLRSRTERVEGIEAGTARLVGTDPQRIVEETERLLRDREQYARMAQTRNPYGDGHAAERIVQIIRGRPVTDFAGSPPPRKGNGDGAAAE